MTGHYGSRGRDDLLLEVTFEAFQSKLRPNSSVLTDVRSRGIVVTCAQSKPEKDEETPFDFVSRWFGPQSGVPEDPVTGSAHCLLGCYWAKKLQKLKLNAFQRSARGGQLGVFVDASSPNSISSKTRVHLSGQAQTVSSGALSNSASKDFFLAFLK